MRDAKKELDAALQTLLHKIDSGHVTCEDFNTLIGKTISESTPEAVRDRTRRRTVRNASASHIEPETGHQRLKTPSLAKRVQPKRKPPHQQEHGRGKSGHAHSARTQRLHAAVEFINKHRGQALSEAILATIPDKPYLKLVATKLLNKPGINRDWLYTLTTQLG